MSLGLHNDIAYMEVNISVLDLLFCLEIGYTDLINHRYPMN